MVRPRPPAIKRQHNSPDEAFGAVVTELRVGKEWSQERLSEKVGCSEPYINRMEQGKLSPTLGMIVALAQVFGLSSSQLLARAERKYLRAQKQNALKTRKF